ncbi:PaaI family thioesterase [Arthrobacter bambusae]
MSERQRVVEWDDPAQALAAMPTMSGLDYMRGLKDGEFPAPPFMALMPMRLVHVELGKTVFEWEPDESYCSPLGDVHGGIVCTLLESALAGAVHTTLPQGQGYTSIDLRVSYLRPVRADSGLLTCAGTVIKPGSRVAFAEGTLVNGDGRLLATASGARLVFPTTG